MIKFCLIKTVEPILKNPKKELSEENPVKAYKLTISDGKRDYTVVSAIVDLFKPEDLLGHAVTFDFSLEPKEIRGFVSEAMIHLNEKDELITQDFDDVIGATYDPITHTITVANNEE